MKVPMVSQALFYMYLSHVSHAVFLGGRTVEQTCCPKAKEASSCSSISMGTKIKSTFTQGNMYYPHNYLARPHQNSDGLKSIVCQNIS